MGFSAGGFFGVRVSTFLRVGFALGVSFAAFLMGTLIAAITWVLLVTPPAAVT